MNTTIAEIETILGIFFPNNPIVKDVIAVLNSIEIGNAFTAPLSLGGHPGQLEWVPSPTPTTPAA